jgi:tellurite resistance protein
VELLGDSDFIKTAVAETKKYFHKMRDHAIRKLVTAIDLARLGDFLASQEIVREIQADVYQFDLNYDLVERERAECLEVLSKIRHFSSKALSELERLDTKWNHFWAKEHDVLNACLGSVQGLVMQRGWRKGGEGWKALQVILNDLRPASEFAGRVIEIESIVFDENAALPAPRDIPASTALLNSLCAIASVDGDFDQQEQNLVLAIAKRLMPSFSEDAVFRLIRNWVVESSKSELSRHLYQAVSDCERIKGSNLRDVSKEAFVLVAKADGNIEENERKIIRKMIAMLS